MKESGSLSDPDSSGQASEASAAVINVSWFLVVLGFLVFFVSLGVLCFFGCSLFLCVFVSGSSVSLGVLCLWVVSWECYLSQGSLFWVFLVHCNRGGHGGIAPKQTSGVTTCTSNFEIPQKSTSKYRSSTLYSDD